MPTPWLVLLIVAASTPTRAADGQALVAELKDPKPAVHDAACAALIAAGASVRMLVAANLADTEANRYHSLAYILDRIDRLYLPGDPWDRSRNVIVGTELDVWLEGKTKHVKVIEGSRRVHIVETDDRITVQAQARECGRDVSEEVTGRTPQELSLQHFGAFDVYQRWGGGIGPIWEVEGRTLTGGKLHEPGPILRRVADRRFDAFRAWVRGQMSAASVTAAGRDEVERGIAAALAALSRPVSEGSDRVQAHNTAADTLRATLARLGLPDPGELLPAPARVRLGVTTTEGPEGRPTVASVPMGTRAERVGLRTGDVIVSVQGRAVDRRRLSDAVRKVGEAPIIIAVLRDGQPLELREAVDAK